MEQLTEEEFKKIKDQTWYKVIYGNKSPNGQMEWNLPTVDWEFPPRVTEEETIYAWVHGNASTVEGDLFLCVNGIHLTTRPERYYLPGMDIYVADFEDTSMMKSQIGRRDKIVVRSAYLIRPLTQKEYNELGIQR